MNETQWELHARNERYYRDACFERMVAQHLALHEINNWYNNQDQTDPMFIRSRQIANEIIHERYRPTSTHRNPLESAISSSSADAAPGMIAQRTNSQ